MLNLDYAECSVFSVLCQPCSYIAVAHVEFFFFFFLLCHITDFNLILDFGKIVRQFQIFSSTLLCM
jgi:hypothetical protein